MGQGQLPPAFRVTSITSFDLTNPENVQINQLHWHVVDSQSFPLQVPGFTELADKGAYSSAMVYSPSDVSDIITYAGAVSVDLGIFVLKDGYSKP